MNLVEKSAISPQELRAWRTRMGMTQAALAAALGLGVRTVTGWERGEAPIPRLAELAIEAIEARTAQRLPLDASGTLSVRGARNPR